MRMVKLFCYSCIWSAVECSIWNQNIDFCSWKVFSCNGTWCLSVFSLTGQGQGWGWRDSQWDRRWQKTVREQSERDERWEKHIKCVSVQTQLMVTCVLPKYHLIPLFLSVFPDMLRQKDTEIMSLLEEKVRLFRGMWEGLNPGEEASRQVEPFFRSACSQEPPQGASIMKDALQEGKTEEGRIYNVCAADASFILQQWSKIDWHE